MSIRARKVRRERRRYMAGCRVIERWKTRVMFGVEIHRGRGVVTFRGFDKAFGGVEVVTVRWVCLDKVPHGISINETIATNRGVWRPIGGLTTAPLFHIRKWFTTHANRFALAEG